MLQRGNAKYSWFWHGDPLTPGAAARPGADRLLPAQAPTLPKIPVVALSYGAASELLPGLEGGASRGFQGGLPFTYHTGPGPVTVEMDVTMDSGPREIVDVLGRIEGKQPDRAIILGTHHDAWTLGGVDPGSSAAAVMELARVLGEASRAGWQPLRTIVFAFWDAEEYGLVGSTEYAEQEEAALRERVVAYVNSDFYLAGHLKAGGVASLQPFCAQVFRDVKDPADPEHTLSGELLPLGSGADFVPFQDFLGLPSLSLELGSEGSYGAYHSSHDTRRYLETQVDPDRRYGLALAELLGRTALRLASAPVVPLRPSRTADVIGGYLRDLEGHNLDEQGQPRLEDLDLAGTRARLKALREGAAAIEGEADRLLFEDPAASLRFRDLSDRLVRSEKAFVDPGPFRAGANWYRHPVYGWDIYSLYAGDTLPGLGRALRDRDAVAFAAERARLEAAVERATAALEGAR
jgi:N-acetylated-alpha-linked acidic dipeptidase